jgi:N-acetylneuraminic acid mutarotase
LSTGVLPLNQWTYLVGTWDNSTKSLDLYVNGVLDHQQTFPGKTSVVNAPLATFQIGASDETLHVGAGSYKAEYFQGGIDEVAYYSVALTSAQVQQHYMAAITTGPWITVAPMPAAEYGPAAAAIGDILYVAGGEGPSGHETPTLQAYNAPTNTWTTLADMPAGRYAGDGAAVINGQLYVPGGWDNTYSHLPHPELFVYDPGTNTWASRASMPHLSAGGVSGAINGKLYVTTPDNGFSGYRNFLDVYDPVSDSWSSLAPTPHVLPEPRRRGNRWQVICGIGIRWLQLDKRS